VLLIEDRDVDRLKAVPGPTWFRVFDLQRMFNLPALFGVFPYHELIVPVVPIDSVLYLGEGHPQRVRVTTHLREAASQDFCFKNNGQNPSAFFKDRGMSVAFHISTIISLNIRARARARPNSSASPWAREYLFSRSPTSSTTA
jgi:threonine synthase